MRVPCTNERCPNKGQAHDSGSLAEKRCQQAKRSAGTSGSSIGGRRMYGGRSAAEVESLKSSLDDPQNYEAMRDKYGEGGCLLRRSNARRGFSMTFEDCDLAFDRDTYSGDIYDAMDEDEDMALFNQAYGTELEIEYTNPNDDGDVYHMSKDPDRRGDLRTIHGSLQDINTFYANGFPNRELSREVFAARRGFERVPQETKHPYTSPQTVDGNNTAYDKQNLGGERRFHQLALKLQDEESALLNRVDFPANPGQYTGAQLTFPNGVGIGAHDGTRDALNRQYGVNLEDVRQPDYADPEADWIRRHERSGGRTPVRVPAACAPVISVYGSTRDVLTFYARLKKDRALEDSIMDVKTP